VRNFKCQFARGINVSMEWQALGSKK